MRPRCAFDCDRDAMRVRDGKPACMFHPDQEPPRTDALGNELTPAVAAAVAKAVARASGARRQYDVNA